MDFQYVIEILNTELRERKKAYDNGIGKPEINTEYIQDTIFQLIYAIKILGEN
jgi:hypothetical protein